MIFSDDAAILIWQAFLDRHHDRLTVQEDGEDFIQLAVRLNSSRQWEVELRRDERYLLANTPVGQAATSNVLQSALTFMGWQEYPRYTLMLRADARLNLGCLRYWPSAHAELELYDLTIGLAKVAGQLHHAIIQGPCQPRMNAV